MATYNQFVVTDVGRSLLAKAVANKGDTFKIGSIATTSHTYKNSDIAGLTKVDDVRQTFPLAYAAADESTVKLQFNITNVGLSTPYTLAALVVYASYNGNDSIPFAVSIASNPDTMNAEQAGALVRNILTTVYIKTDNASAITIAVSMDTYVTKAMLDAAEKNALDKAHPIGSVYLCIGGQDPATAFGGTWKKIEGSYLLASGSYDGQTLTAGKQIGETRHTITQQEMPPHSHSGNTDGAGNHYHGTWGEHQKYGGGPFGAYNWNSNHAGSNGDVDWDNILYKTSTDGWHSHHFTTANAGGGQSMLVMPLATVVDAWYRTA